MGPVLQAFQMNRREEVQDGVRQYLTRLHQQLLSGAVPQGRNGRVTVFILGRYQADRSAVPAEWRTSFGSTMDVEFLTAHRSKGREADYVILPGMVNRGFPSLRSDDPRRAAVVLCGTDACASLGGDVHPAGQALALPG
ncbi:hypothetical protein G6F59_016742 [Rhizopus arrhizus]|nr:hypothetical protein G6F59_016742 [Rhizopus arrhizus]